MTSIVDGLLLDQPGHRTLSSDVDGGPWGNAMDVIFCLLPIVYLLYATLKRNPTSTTVSLPVGAFMLFMIRLMYLGSDPLLVCASVISGLHEALSPLAIMCGAIFLFQTMDATLCMPFMLREMKSLSKGNPIAETMLLFSFAYMVEGASGFGTPAALGAPMLASLGYSKLDSVVLLLMFNTLATVWGAVGTPIWFGFGNLNLTESQFDDISYKAGVALFIGGIILLPTVALRVVCPWSSTIRPNLLFIVCSFLSCAGLSMGLSFLSYEFPSLVGGMVGCVMTGIFIHFKVGLYDVPPVATTTGGSTTTPSMTTNKMSSFIMDGDVEQGAIGTVKYDGNSSHTSKEGQTEVFSDINLEREPTETIIDGAVEATSITQNTSADDTDKVESDNDHADNNCQDEEVSHGDNRYAEAELLLGPRRSMKEGYLLDVIGRTFPLWGTVLLLMVTRIEQVGLKGVLTRTDPAFQIDFGTYGIFRLSASLVIQLNSILTVEGVNWKFPLLYVPFLLPFLLISVLTMILYRSNLQKRPRAIASTTLQSLKDPAIALLGALVLVKLLIDGGSSSPAYLIGTILSDALQEGWVVFACFVGMLGSFFSGSTTVSNLTFGGIQLIAAENIGVSETTMLALQAVGGSAGNGVCLNNIIAACTVVGLTNVGEGTVIGRTGPFVLALCTISTLVMLAFFFRFN